MLHRSPIQIEHPPSYELLKKWLDEKDIIVHRSIRPVFDQKTGWTLHTSEVIPRGQVLCAVPKQVVFSHRTASLPTLTLPPEAGAAEHTLHLAACLLHEIRLGHESVFHPWIQALPRETILLPTFWNNHEMCGEDGRAGLEWLVGTEGEKELQRKNGDGLSMTDIEFYFHSNVHTFPLTKSHPESPSIHDLLYAFSMISTRGYVIDAFHIIALIPFVDLFNHSSNNDTSLASDSTVCPQCGSLARCQHDADEERISHFTPGYVKKAQEEGNRVDMRAEREIQIGEVYSCYEEDVSDGKLLVEWGFYAGEKQASVISWSPREILDQSIGQAYMAMVNSGEVSRRISNLQGSARYIHLGENPGQFDIRQKGTISDNLVIALYLHSLDTFPESLDELEEGLVGIVKEQIDGRRLSNVPSLAAVVQRLGELVNARLGGMHCSDVSLDKLEEKKPTSPLALQAFNLAYEERRVLTRLLETWRKSS